MTMKEITTVSPGSSHDCAEISLTHNQPGTELGPESWLQYEDQGLRGIGTEVGYLGWARSLDVNGEAPSYDWTSSMGDCPCLCLSKTNSGHSLLLMQNLAMINLLWIPWSHFASLPISWDAYSSISIENSCLVPPIGIFLMNHYELIA
jgi:hypothetical protein